MKNKTILTFSLFAGLFMLFSCCLKPEEGMVYEIAIHQNVLKADSIRLGKKLSAIRLDSLPMGLEKKIDLNRKLLAYVNKQLIEIDPPAPEPSPGGPSGGPNPPDPNPCPQGNCPQLIGIKGIIVPKDIKNFQVVIMDQEGEIVGHSGEPKAYGADPGFLVYPLTVGATGNLELEITKYSGALDQAISYRVDVLYPKK